MNATIRILVTGATGFLGSHIVARGALAGYEMIAGHRCAATPPPRSVLLDVCADGSVAAALRSVRPSCIIHCASYGVKYDDQEQRTALRINVLGSLRVLETAAQYGVERFVHIGSCAEYGHHPGRISEDTPLNPAAVYGATKAAATLLMRDRARELNVPLAIIRPFGIWGPGEPSYRLIPQIIGACLTRRHLQLTSCDVLRDYTYVEDVADMILSIAARPSFPSGTIVNLGSGDGVVLREFVLSIASLLQGEALMHFGALKRRPTEMTSLVADVQRLHSMLRNIPKTSLADGLRRTLASMLSQSSTAAR